MAGKVICYHQLPSDSVTVSTSVLSAETKAQADIKSSEIRDRDERSDDRGDGLG